MNDKKKIWTAAKCLLQSIKMKKVCQTINNTGKKYKKSERQTQKENIPQNTAYWHRKHKGKL